MFPTELRTRLEEKSRQGSFRTLCFRKGVDLSSNDYLDFTQDRQLQARFLSRLQQEIQEFKEGKCSWSGSTGSRLLRGNSEVFEETEVKLAKFCGRHAALIFPSGYQANLGLLSALLGSEDTVFSDELNHASLIDGIRLGRAQKYIYPHLDLNQLEHLLRTTPHGKNGLRWIVTESLFGMEGDQAPLQDLVFLSEKYSAQLIVDEAHATGIWGDFESRRGGGLVQALHLSSRVFATLHTGGKALGCGGAWVAGDPELKTYLINFSRPLIFSTAPVPALPLLLQETLDHWKEVGPILAEEVLRQAKTLGAALRNRITEFYSAGQIRKQGTEIVPETQGPILPILIGDNLKTLALASVLREQGFDLRAIRPPTVQEGKARLRLTCHPSFSSSLQNRLIDVLIENLIHLENEFKGTSENG